jgi:hypothetical protein
VCTTLSGALVDQRGVDAVLFGPDFLALAEFRLAAGAAAQQLVDEFLDHGF